MFEVYREGRMKSRIIEVQCRILAVPHLAVELHSLHPSWCYCNIKKRGNDDGGDHPLSLNMGSARTAKNLACSKTNNSRDEIISFDSLERKDLYLIFEFNCPFHNTRTLHNSCA